MDNHRDHVGHPHFWKRALSRRQFIGSTAAATGAIVSSGFWLPPVFAAAFAEADPQPIPGGTLLPFQPTPFHFFFPTDGVPGAQTIASGEGDPSMITDFDGFVGVADVGQGTGTDGTGRSLLWAADVRFMKGTYVGAEGNTRTGAFAFI
jgi:hypothetical protein